MVIWLCLYEHRFGTDVAAYLTAHDAYLGACNVVLDNLSDVEALDTRKAIVNAIEDGNYLDAMTLYSDAAEESFEIVDRDVHNEEELNKELSARSAKIQTALQEEERA